MTWFYAVGGEQRGPVDDAALDRLIAAGEIGPDTLVWRAGMAEWRPLRDARAAAAPPILPPPRPAPLPPVDSRAELVRLSAIAEHRRVRVFDAIRRGFALVFDDLAPSVGVSALALLTLIGAGFVPCVGSLVQILVTGPIVAGWYRYFLRRLRGEPAEWSDVFAGFSEPGFVQLVLAYLVTLLAALVVMMPAIVVMIGLIGISAAAGDHAGPFFVVLAIGTFALVLCGWIYLQISWTFAPALILDKRLEFWPAMELSRRGVARSFFPVLGLMILCWLITVAGLLLLCLGLFLALPIATASMAYAYEDLFGETPAR